MAIAPYAPRLLCELACLPSYMTVSIRYVYLPTGHNNT